MLLHELPRSKEGIVFYVKKDTSKTQYMFHHVDGIYSYCTDGNGNVIHIGAYVEICIPPRLIAISCALDSELEAMLAKESYTPYYKALVATEMYLRR